MSLSVDGMRRLADLIARTHGFTIVERTVMPKGVAAYFDWRTKTATVPPLVDDVSFAIRLHEFGHGIAGDCTNRAPHYRDPAVADWHCCLECERIAWVEARRLVTFTPAMFTRLQQSLNHYRRRTPAHAAVRAAAAHAVDFAEAFAKPFLRRVEQELRQERVEESLRPAHIRVDEEIVRQRAIRARQLARRQSRWTM